MQPVVNRNARYHAPMMKAETRERESALPEGRQAGICLHLTSLPGPYGIGELGAGAHRFIDRAAAAGIRVWQFLPTGPTAYGDSPYQPLSTFAGNELLIDVEWLVERGLLERDEAAPLRSLPVGTVDYGNVIPAKHALLGIAASRFAARAPGHLRVALDEFLHRHDDFWLHDYAQFRLLKTRHGERPWTEWDRQYVHRERRALRELDRSEAAGIDTIKIVQFLFDYQWSELRERARERGVFLFGDMPICIALDSADAWAHRELLRIDEDGRPDSVAGVPPDYFSRDGQLWGNPLYDWRYHDANGYAWWIARLRHAAGLMNMVRIDHFRGFEAYWSVPAGEATARHGRWEPGPGNAIFDAMHDALGHLPIVAEDLGVITPQVISLRERHSIPGMKVLQFDVETDDFDIDRMDENCVCYTGTHDNDTTVGWFHGSRDDMRSPAEIARTQEKLHEMTGATSRTVHREMIRLAYGSRARLAMAPMQDHLGLGSEARLNTPGTSRGNWRWRLEAIPGQALFDEYGEMAASTGRGS